jgi:hypothetical protein
MKLSTWRRFCCLAALGASLAGGGTAFADQPAVIDSGKALQEMPLLTGVEWQTLSRDAKFAFILGIGHVVTVEEHVVQRHPELKRDDFVAKLAEGLKGVPMRDIVQELDSFYRTNPDDLDLPVMRVIWSQLVKPKLASGPAGRPFNPENDK